MTFILIKTIKEQLDEQLPTVGMFRRVASKVEFTGLLELNQERNQYLAKTSVEPYPKQKTPPTPHSEFQWFELKVQELF